MVVFPEGTRSRDGFVGPFRMGAAELAVACRVPVIPVGILGTYAAMPRGSHWPLPGRPRVSVRYGPPIIPSPNETPSEFAPKIFDAVKKLLAEDAATWWRAQRGSMSLSRRHRAGGASGSRVTRRSKVARRRTSRSGAADGPLWVVCDHKRPNGPALA